MQLVDELGMIYTTCLMAYATFGHMRGVAYRAVLGTSVSALAIFITVRTSFSSSPLRGSTVVQPSSTHTLIFPLNHPNRRTTTPPRTPSSTRMPTES